ncbi:ankyrin-2 isoform X9 [Rhipicephalus sanguineus]|uniref:ankyrin-2 isoform X9 n=1 Tax=Rhipicephalus sanguineus TaxID=34632 RepID=UPI0020C1E07A|nr:ankyrin-2 isoform X9 [Rhipicephalus sanguineus]
MGDPATRPSRETWIGCFIRLLASHGDQCDPSLYLFLRWLAVLLFRSILSQMMPSATDGNASFLRAARAGNLEKVLDYLKGSIDINTSNANGLNALHLAAKEGHVNVVSELLKRGANVNATTKKGNSALHIASLAGQEEVVKLLVQKQANVNVQSQNGFTPLYMAAQENHDGVVRFLLANGANQSLATEDGFTPLAVALQQGHDKVVAVLLENDARGKVRLPALHIASKKDDCKAAALLLHSEHNPDVTSKSGFTPLHIAAHYGNSNIASLLLEKGADVNFPAKHQITPLHVAAKWGKSNMVKLLLEKGAKIDASTRDGLTPLHCAARSGHDQVVEQLLEKNAPITAKTKNGLAPLHMASQGDHVDSARILLYHKAPVDDVTVDYLTALHVAAHCGHVGVAKLLLDRRADPNARALNGFTPLHIACKKNRIKVVELLLKHGASIEATTESGLTPLHVASFMGCMNIVIYLIQHGANPDIPTVRGETPLHLAARANQTDIIRILLRNGAHVDAKARELQTALHIASRLGNADMVGLLLQHGAAVDAPTKDAYTPLHVAAREGQDEVAALLLDHGAALAAPTKKGFTPLHLAAKYGNLKVAQLLLQKDAPVDAQGKNGVTPLHVAAHYDHVNVALLLLEKGASPHSAARNGYTPLHVAARKDQMDIASSLLEYGAKPGAESRAGFTPLHLAAQEGHADLAALLVEHGADCDAKAKNGLTPMHLCAQEDRVEVATILAKHGASLDPTTKAGYTPLHVACHFGQTNMIRFLLRQGANVNATTSHGYTPLHQAAQQGHTLIINLLLEHRAAPNAITNQGQTALAIAQRLGYISVVETLKVVTETIVTTTTTTVTEEKYRVVAPETMHETFMSDSEDEAAEDNMLGDQSFRYLTADEMKSLGDDSLPIDVTRDERITESIHIMREPGHSAPLTQEEERLSPTQAHTTEAVFVGNYAPDNVDLSRTPIHAGSLLSWDGDSCSSAYVLSPTKRMWRESSKLKWKTFLVSFMVDARGGAMRGCRHSGVRVIIPPRKAQMPMRITCRYLRKEKLPHPPPLLEGEACASRILEVGPAGAKFLGPVILEVPHFASLRGKEREISILRSDNGETWKEHTLEASEEAVQEVLNESFEGEELSALEDLQTNRIVRILTTDFPQYFAVVSRTRQEVHAVGPEGGLLSSTVVPQVQAIFPEGALTKKIRVGLQAQPIPAELVTKLLGHRVAVSPIVTVEPRRRKFHKPITLTIPVPQAATKGMINQYAGDAPTLRLLCSITASRRHGQLTGEYRLEAGGTNKAQWEDVTGSTPLTFVNDCVSFTTTVSARFWLMDCRQVSEATKFATELYAEAMHVPFMAKFVVFAKRLDPMEAQLRVFCMTDDKEDKTLESQEHFTEVAKSRDVEVLEKKSQYLEFGGNLVPVTKSGEQLQLQFQAFRENRLPFSVRVKDPHQEPLGRLAFMRQPRAARATEPPQAPLCNLNIALPEYEATQNLSELVTLEKKYGFVEETGLAKPELIHRADLRLSDIARELGSDWPALAAQLDVPEQDVASIRTECPSDLAQQALLMLRLWMKRAGGRATGNNLEKGLRMINREDIVNKCMFNVELVTDDVEKAVAKVHLDQSGFDTFREELGTPKDTSLKRDASLDVSYDEQDLMKEAESAEETSSETGSVHEKHTGSEAKGTSKAVPGVRKGSPISAAIGRIVRGSSKEKAAPRMAVEETFEEEPVLKTDSAEVTQQAAVETGPTAPPRDPKKKSKREKSPKAQGPDYSLPRIRDSITPERDFTSTTDAMTVSSIREAVDASKEPAADGKLKKEKKKDKKEKSPSPPGPDYTLPRLRDTYTPSDSATAAGYAGSTLPEEDVTPKKDIAKTSSFKRRSKERSLSPDLTRTGENGSLGADFSIEEQEKRVQKSPEGNLVEKVEKIVKETPGKIVEIVHIKRQRSSKSPEGTGSSGDKDKKRLPSFEVEIPDTSDAEKHKEQKEASPLKQRKKDLKEVTEPVDKDVELSVSDGKSQDTGFLSKMAKLPKKMFPRSGKASASDEEPSSISESSPIAKKKSGKLPKSATLPKASEKPSKKPLHEIKSVDVEVGTSKFTSKGSKDALAKDGEDLETSTGDIVKESDGRFFARMAKIPKKMFPRSSKTSSSEDEPSSASESLPSSKQKAKKEPKLDATLKKKEKGIKIKQDDTQTLPASIDVDISSRTSLPSGVDIGIKKVGKPELPDIEIKKKSKGIKTSFPSGVEVAGSVEEPMIDIDISGIKSQPKELEVTVDGKHPDIHSDVELSLTSKETTLEWPDKAEGTIETSTPEHGKPTKSGFMTKMAKFPKKMFPHGFKGDVSVEEPSISAESIHVSVPETQLTLDTDKEVMVSDTLPKELAASVPEGVEGSIELSAQDPSMSSEKGFISKVTRLPRKIFSHDSKDGVSVEGPSVAMKGIDIEFSQPELQIETRGKGFEVPETIVDITLPTKKGTPNLPDRPEGHIDASLDTLGKSAEYDVMSKMTTMPKKLLPEDAKVQAPQGLSAQPLDVHGSIPKAGSNLDIKANIPDEPQADFDTLPGKGVSVEIPESIGGRVEISHPGVPKPSDGGFMAKMAKLPKKIFPHGSKGSVSIEAPEAISGAQIKAPEAQLKVDVKGPERPELEAEIGLPDKEVAMDFPEGTEAKVAMSTPEIGKISDDSFVSKMGKIPKKIFPHGSKASSISVEGAPEVGDVHAKMPEAHLKMDVRGIEKPVLEADIGMPDKSVGIDLPEGIEGKVEISGPEIGKPSDGGFMSKMAKLPKKMFPHGSKEGSISVEGAPEVGDVHAKMPEAHLKMDVRGIEKPVLEADIGMPDKSVGIDLPEGIEGKVEISGPEIGKPSDGSFMSKMAKLPKKMFSHGSKGSVSLGEAPEVASGVQVKLPETRLKVDSKSHERPELDVDVSLPEVSAGVPEGSEGKLGITTPELGKPAGSGFMIKMDNVSQKMLLHSPKGKDSIEYASGLVGDAEVNVPEADLVVDVEGSGKIESDVLKGKKLAVDLTGGIGGDSEIAVAEVEKPSDSGFMSKMAKFPKKMFPHSSKGEVSLEGAPELVSDVPAELPEAHVKLHVKDKKPVAEEGILLPESEVTLDLAGGIEGKVEVTSEVGKSSDAGFVSKISKLPKKLLPHGKKAGTSFEEPIVTAEGAHVDIPQPEATLKIEAKLPTKPEASADITIPAKDGSAGTSESVAGKLEIDVSETGKASDKGFMSKMAKFPKKIFHHSPKSSGSTDEHSTAAESTDIKMPDVGVELQTHVKTTKKPEADVSVSLYEKEVTVQLPEGSKGVIEISTPKLVGEHVPDGATQGAEIALPGMELPTMERQETKETPGGVVEVIEVTTHEVSKPSSPGLLSKVSKIPKKIFPRGSKSKSSDEESPSTPKRELKETPGGIVEVIEVTKHDVAKAPELKHMEQDGTKVFQPASPKTVASSIEGFPPTHMTREIKEVPGGVVEVVRVTKHVVGKLPEDKHSGESCTRTVDPAIPWEAELAKDPSAVVKREVKETPEGHVEVVQVIRREAGDAPFVSDFPGDGSDGTVSRRIETTVVDGKPTIIRRLVTTTSDGIQQVTEHIEQGAEELGSTASSLFAKMGEFARGLSSDDPSAVTTREVKKLPDGSVEVVSITKRSSSSPGKETASTEHLPSSPSGSMHFAESAAGKPTEAKTAILKREISGPETIVCTTSVVTSATTSGSSKPELSADILDKMFGDIGKPKVDDRLKDVLTAEGGYGAKREVTPEEAELLAQLFPEQSSGVAPYPPAGLVPEAAIIPEYRSMMATEGPPLSPHDPETKEKVLLKLGRALSQDDLDAPSPTRGEAAMTVAGLGEAVDASDQVEEPVVEKLELARRESKRYSQEFEQDEPLPKAMGLKTKPSEETVVSSTQVKGIHDNGTVKHTVTTVTKTTIIQEVEEPAGAPRPGESETWASDLDTSQVSVSSLPEDERTEPTLSSSTTTATADAEALSGPLARTQVEEKEWTETDPDSGEVRHIISKTTHTTVTSVKPGEGAPRGDTMSTSVSQSSKGGHGGSAASAPSSHNEAESLTFCQKKEFFEKLSEQSPLQETFSSRLGSTPSLDTALTRPVVTVKPRPRSESLTSQGEIIEENIVFAERLRLFQNGAQASSSPGASLPHLDLMDQRRQSRDQRLQGLPEMTDSLQQQSSEVLAGLQDTYGKSDTRLLVHTSDADKEAFDVCSVQSSEDVGDQQFSRMRVRMPATEECVSETLISSCDLPGEKPSPLRDAYKDSLTPQQEGSHTERDAAVAESSHAPSAAADPATSAGRSAGGRERSPLLEASPPEETAYSPAQDISPAQEYPEYLTPDMQVRVGVSPTEAQPAKEKPVRYSESSVESSSEVGSPCPPSQGGTAMAFENVAFAGEDVIDATSSPVEESSSPTGSRSPYEVVRDAPTEETAEAALLKAEKSLHHVVQEVRPRPQSLVAEECSEQIEQQVKPTIFNEAFDHSPKEIAPEKKELSEGLLGVGLLTVSDMTARTPESRRGDSDEDEEEWADHVMSKIRGRPIPPTPPASPRAVQSVEVHDEKVTWEASAAEQEEVHINLVSDMTANEETVVKIDESAAIDDDSTSQPQLQEVIRSTDGKRPQLEHIPSEISDEDLVEREQSPTHITATCRGDRKDSSSDRNSSPDSDGPKACGSHRRSASGVGAIVLESGETQKGDSSDKYSQESRDQGAQELEDKITEEPECDMFVIEEEALVESSRTGLSYDDGNETGTRAAGTLSPDLDSPPKKKDGDDGSSSGKLDAASPVVLRSKSKRTEKKSEKRSSRDMDTGHSGSETDHSHYYSFEMTSDSGKTPGASRPTSSEFDVNILSGQASSEYETCATSQDGEVSGSYATAAASSHDTSFATARSSLSGSSRGSAYSVDSESSGHLGSMEVSEASETIVASAHEEFDSDNESERSKSVLREPYDGEIPESVIRGGVEHPFLPSWQPVAKEAAPKLHAPVGARPSSSEAALSQVHSAVPAEPGRSCTGWPSASSSNAPGDTSRSTSKAEILNGTGSSASLDGQRRLRHNDDYMASSHEEEQLSVSESSATQSEHTWQTSVETMVDAVEAQRLSCERERNHRQSTIQNSVSLPFDDVVAEGAEADRNTGDDRATPPFQEVNGPVEVEYMPEYDDLSARTLRSVLEQNVPEGQMEVQGAVATPEASHDEGLEVSSSRELDEQEDSTELREEGFYAETFQGDLSSEEVESAADAGLLQGRSACSSNAYCDKVTRHLDSSVRCEVKNISLTEPFDRPATPEPVDEVDGEDHKVNTSQRHFSDDNGDMFRHVCAGTPMCNDKTEIKQDCPEDDRCNFLAGSGSYSIQDQPRSESASSSPGRDTADDVKLYTSKCEDYILQMHQTYKYGVGLSNTSDGSSYLPEEGMDVENVKLLASRLQEGNGSQQDFPYDLSYEHEYVGDVRAEHGDLYTHQEVEEEAYDDERTRMRGRRRLSPISDERGSTPDYDTLGGRKTFGKGSEKDDASTSSLMEFERLEAEMASGAKSSSVGSSDSFSGRQHQIRNGTGSEQDSVSVNSLTEFERLEKEIVEAEGVDTRLRGEAVPKLDEIDEGHESQASDPGHETTVYDENGITLLREAAADSGVKDEYDGKGDDTHLEEILTSNEQEVALSRTERHFLTTRTESGHSVDSVDRQSSASTATQFDADSLRDREIDDSESNFGPDTPGWTQKECTDLDSLHDSLHDSERYDSLQEALSKDKDSLQLREPSAEADSLQDDCNELQDSLYEARDIEWDSVRTEDDPSHNWHQFSSQIRTTELSPTLSRPASSPLVVPVVVERIDTLTWVDQDPTKAFIADEESLDRPQDRPRTDALVSSTDSLEPSSSANTHATYQCDTDSMMSSLNSAEESTMVSSTDTLDHEALHFASSGKPLHLESSLQMEGDITDEHLDYATTDPSQNKQRPAVGDRSADDIEERFRECLLRSAASPTDEEQVEERQTIDEKGNLIVTRTVKRHVTSEPRLHAQTFAGPDAEQRSREFVASFSSIEPSSEKDECEGFDAAGNAVRVTQHVLVRPIVKTVTFTGPDAQLQMREYMRNLAGGQQSSAENTPTSDSGVGVCSSLASPPPLVPDPPATAPSSACPGLQRLSGGDHWMEAESALDDSSRPVTATRVITTRTTRTVGPDGREQLVTTTTEEGAGGDEPELRLRRSMQGVLDSFMADPSAPPPHSDEE